MLEFFWEDYDTAITKLSFENELLDGLDAPVLVL